MAFTPDTLADEDRLLCLSRLPSDFTPPFALGLFELFILCCSKSVFLCGLLVNTTGGSRLVPLRVKETFSLSFRIGKTDGKTKNIDCDLGWVTQVLCRWAFVS